MSTTQMPTALLQGTLDLLILKALSLQPLHGLDASRRIEQITRGTFQVRAGSLFPALYRMEKAGWIEADWGETENNRRAKYSSRARAGRRQLKTETQQWSRVSVAIAHALRTA
jgi:transcriptional regulator, Acidobacterial, PadR-family